MDNNVESNLNYNQIKLAQEKELTRIKKNSNSKDEILLEKQGSEFFIKKTWIDVNRGFKSIKKQIEFDEIRISNIIVRSPTVYSTEYVGDNNFIAKMEYIDGCSGPDITKYGTRKISQSLKNAFSMILNQNIENAVLKKVDTNIFIEKIDSILGVVTNEDLFLKKIRFLKDKFMIYKYIEIPLGSCHGDLTLSNVIVSPTGSLNLIDFLPTFIDSPLWDIVKLKQDLIYGWSYRNLKGPSYASSKLFFQSCIPNQLKIYEKVWNYEILLLNALNLARIIPYIKDNNTKEWLDLKFTKALNKLN